MAGCSLLMRLPLMAAFKSTAEVMTFRILVEESNGHHRDLRLRSVVPFLKPDWN